MAVQVTTASGEGAKRQDMLLVNPFDVIVREELRGRTFPPTAEDVRDRAESIMDQGQLQPCKVRRMPDKSLLLTLGFTRCNAARLIRTGFTDSQGEFRQNPDFRLQVTLTDCNDQEAFLQNVAENNQRNKTSDIDDAVNQNRMRQDYGMNDAQIARFYNYKSSNQVGRLRKLLALSNEGRRLVHTGQMSTNAALELLELTPDEQQQIITKAIAEDTKVDAAEIRDFHRILSDNHLDQLEEEENSEEEATDESTILSINTDDVPFGDPSPMTTSNVTTKPARTRPAPATGVTVKARSMREIKRFFDGLIADEDTLDPTKRFAKDFLEYLSGKKSDKAMENAFDRFASAMVALAAEDEEPSEEEETEA